MIVLRIFKYRGKYLLQQVPVLYEEIITELVFFVFIRDPVIDVIGIEINFWIDVVHFLF
jgi:hypothetical protein